MTDTLTVLCLLGTAVISAAPPFIMALKAKNVAAESKEQSVHNAGKIEAVSSKIDGRMDELLELSRKASEALGITKGKALGVTEGRAQVTEEIKKEKDP